MKMEDLYLMFKHRLDAGIPSLHPHRWLAAHAFNYLPPYILDCRFKRLSLFDIAASSDAPIVILRQHAIHDADRGRKALRALGRQADCDVYWAHPLLADQYYSHRPSGVGIQDAVKDFLMEHVPRLRLEVRTPVGPTDGLTSRAVLEVAQLKSWKQGLGQLCAYALHFPGRKKILILFGAARRPRALAQIRWTCRHYGVHVGYIRCDRESFGMKPKATLPERGDRLGIHTCGSGDHCCYESLHALRLRREQAAPSRDSYDAIDLSCLG